MKLISFSITVLWCSPAVNKHQMLLPQVTGVIQPWLQDQVNGVLIAMMLSWGVDTSQVWGNTLWDVRVRFLSACA